MLDDIVKAMTNHVTSQEQQLRPTSELLDQLASVSQQLESASPEEIITWGVERFGDRLTMGTAFGPEGMTILARLAVISPSTHVFNLETGYQFKETLELRDEVERRYGISVELMKPELSVAEYEAKHGGPVYKSNPDQCCADRKLAVLKRSVIGRHAWISAIRRDQSPDRARSPIIGWDKKFGLVKINPLANSTKEEIWKYITDNDVPYNELHDKGYPSIGCWPCTRSVMFGGDDREGRWNGFQKTECGLHSLDPPSTRSDETVAEDASVDKNGDNTHG